MIDLYTWHTPNGRKVSIMLEEIGMTYNVFPINIAKDEQFQPHFLEVSPNNRIPAIVDKDNNNYSLFESGAILLYFAERHEKFFSNNIFKKYEIIQWLSWQIAGFGPMLGQAHHFNFYAIETIEYAKSRYSNEANRLYGVLNKKLNNQKWITGEYSIADIATYPWTITTERQGVNLEDSPREKKISRTSLSGDSNDDIQLRSNNSFLHDNVD